MDWQLSRYLILRREEELHIPGDFTVREEDKPRGKWWDLALWLSCLLPGSVWVCSPSVRPQFKAGFPVSDILSLILFDLLASISLILYYIVLSCILISYLVKLSFLLRSLLLFCFWTELPFPFHSPFPFPFLAWRACCPLLRAQTDLDNFMTIIFLQTLSFIKRLRLVLGVGGGKRYFLLLILRIQISTEK